MKIRHFSRLVGVHRFVNQSPSTAIELAILNLTLDRKGGFLGLWLDILILTSLATTPSFPVTSSMDLSQLLLDNGINLDRWSRDRGTKNIADLAAEITAGETKLESIEGILTRIVRVVKISIDVRLGDKLFRLIEDKQIFFTGAVRQRGLKNIAEKMQGHETPLQTVQRALKEEIGLEFTGAWIFTGEENQQLNSPSYPGLNSCYQMFNYQITLSAADLSKLRFAEVRGEKISLFTLEAIV
jgi:hypothetical protein